MVEGDGIGYYSYLHSVAVDHDLELGDEYAAAAAAHVTLWPALVGTRTATGRAADYFPVGPALLAAPFYGAALAVRPDGEPQYGRLFVGAFTVASLLFGLLALALVFRLTRSGWAVAALAATSAFPYYLLYEPSYSHTFSAFAVSLFVFAWWRGRDSRGRAGWLLLGLLAGLMAITRFQDGPLAAIALLDLRRGRLRLLLMVPGLVLGLLPQALVDQQLFGSWLPERPPGQELQLLPGHYLDVLFSTHHGLFSWHPVTLAAVAGFALVRSRALRAACVYAFVVEVMIGGATPDWWGGYAFGGRRFLDLLPFWGIGLAALVRHLASPVRETALVLLGVWNALLAASLTYVMRADVDPGWGGLLAGQEAAFHHLPRLLAQGAAARDLALWPVLGRPPDPAAGLALLGAEAACLALAWAVARVTLRGHGRAER